MAIIIESGTKLLYSEPFWHAVIIIDSIIIASYSGTQLYVDYNSEPSWHALICRFYIASRSGMQLYVDSI